MAKVDLHLHSSVSDGVLDPAGLVEKAAGLGLTAIALTDHDNVDGIAPAIEAVNRFPGLAFVPGIEISSDIRDGEVHVLGYFVDHTDQAFLARLDDMRNSRIARAKKMVDKLARLGAGLDWERVQQIAGEGSVGRPHIAQALMEKGYTSTIQEAFTRYLAFNRPAYVQRDKMTPEEALQRIISAGGTAVLAHPLSKGRSNPEQLIKRLVKAGLAGLEAHYKSYPGEDREMLVRLADKYGLITTGGSDYHGLDEETEVMMGEAGVPPEVIDNLIKIAGKQPYRAEAL